MAAAVAAVIAARERQLVEMFEQHRATSPASARTLDEMGLDPDGLGFRHLSRRAIVRQTNDGRYYVDLEAWQARQALRRRVALVMVPIAVGVALAVYLLSWWRR